MFFSKHKQWAKTDRDWRRPELESQRFKCICSSNNENPSVSRVYSAVRNRKLKFHRLMVAGKGSGFQSFFNLESESWFCKGESHKTFV